MQYKLRLMTFVLLLVLLSPYAVVPVFAQSRDSNNPTELLTNSLKGELEPGGQSQYYSFVAGPGAVGITFSGKTDYYSTSTHVILVGEKGQELANLVFAANGNGGTRSATVKLPSRQKVRLQLLFGVDVGVRLTYSLSIGGPVVFAQANTTKHPEDQVTQAPQLSEIESPQDTGRAPSPSNGTVNSGSTLDQDLPPEPQLEANLKANLKAKSETSFLAQSESGQKELSSPVEDKWAIVVGVSKFQNPSIDLKYPAKDAKDLYDYLVKEANFAPDHVKLLVNENATKERLLAALGDKWLPRLAHPNDLVLIFISTHGSPSGSDIEGLNYLVMHNTDPTSLFATGLPLTDLAEVIKKRVHAKRVVLIVDACHSGAANTAKGLYRQANFDSNALSQGTGQLIICSSEPNQVSWESKRYANGVFTHQLIEALRSQSGKPTLGEAFQKLKEAVQTEVLQDRSELQTAVMKAKWHGEDLIISTPPTKPRVIPESIGQF